MRLRSLLMMTLLAALPLAAQTPAKRPMTFADLMAMKRVSDPQISPSGKWVLFSVTDVSSKRTPRPTICGWCRSTAQRRSAR